jgi:hypothetical protein
MKLTEDRDSLVAKNICAVFAPNGPFGQPTTFEEVQRRFAPDSRPR